MKGNETPQIGTPVNGALAVSSPAIRTNFPEEIANSDDLRTGFAHFRFDPQL